MSGHTPGPWKVERRGERSTGYLVVEPTEPKDWGIVINVPCPPFALGAVGALVCTANLSDEDAMQRARLIAAAPDLLAALKACRDRLHYLAVNEVGEHPHSLINGLRVSTADEAIAKAEGRS